ncbi:hypothetical protein CGZ91_01205 [Parenemella sanctibonifatiensis]|uniref:RDD domain-containing protein n=1 Tax=Parenemella sanctibonifatiensis TaxID=2016505 RepID=A0A255EKV5_9ACTN|nr:hypothetical protein CGZ92_06240 [Parenemella sanctibonifatiensis]OYN92156.1 hypothetical protein CGZ91_01205 [Parenemella sanctibonifatiensis]
MGVTIDDVSHIITGDAVVLDLRPARLPTRVLAVLPDLLIILALSYGWWWVQRQATGASDAGFTSVVLIGQIIILFAVPISIEVLTKGRSLGKWMMGLRAVRDDGGPLRFRQSLIRGLAFWLLDFAPWTGLLGGIVSATLHPHGKRLGDLLSGSMVVRTRAPRMTGETPSPDPTLRDWTDTLELSRLDDELVAAARYVVLRGPRMRPAPARQLALDVAGQVERKIAPQPPTVLPPEQFLAEVLSELNRRSRTRHTSRRVPTADQLPAGWR